MWFTTTLKEARSLWYTKALNDAILFVIYHSSEGRHSLFVVYHSSEGRHTLFMVYHSFERRYTLFVVYYSSEEGRHTLHLFNNTFWTYVNCSSEGLHILNVVHSKWFSNALKDSIHSVWFTAALKDSICKTILHRTVGT